MAPFSEADLYYQRGGRIDELLLKATHVPFGRKGRREAGRRALLKDWPRGKTEALEFSSMNFVTRR